MKILFLDMDECLVATTTLEKSINLFRYPHNVHRGRYFLDKINGPEKELIKFANNSDVKIIDILGQLWATKLRPGVFEFLKEVKEIFDAVYILTAGSYAFQNAVLFTHDILYEIDGIFSSKDSYCDIPQIENSILVDDLGLNALMLIDKLTLMDKISKQEYKDIVNKKMPDEDILRLFKRVSPYRIQIREYRGSDSDRELQRILSLLKKWVNSI